VADAGVPDGLMAGIMVRATPRLRLHAAGGHNTMSAGLRGGVRADAFTGSVSPFVAVEVGYYFAGAPQPWARSLAERAGTGDAQLDRVGYRFANGHLGIRFGDRRAALFLQGGASHVSSRLGIVEERAMETGTEVEIRATTRLSGWVPAGRFGFVSYF
jgi:hypothetical protein